MFKIAAIAIIASVALVGCDGPNEKAGAERDKAAQAAVGQAYSGNGPNERIGEAEDRAIAAAERERASIAETIEAKSENVQRQADVAADRLEEQAKAIRRKADEEATALKQQADATR